ncbi:hypothetical protein [Lysinibacillus sp. SGAir0095]|uniref:hypothetical protein n=1 Tax=Lysinibacillus sp. SGAir0095 TaxID=2070463 RepID=UPI0010CD1B91|nr:hypothetical protein [Lysinibacillus sp. SGAir0095]QCR33583.1 hypothetical protein C1N55_16105 [Lysinibacillus sp. SGAir0095]
MEYNIKKTEIKYEIGKYFTNECEDNLYQIIYDSDRGYAILDVEKGELTSDFIETKDDLITYTTLTSMKPLKQVGIAKFEVNTE